MTVADVLTAAIAGNLLVVQYLHECVLGARTVKPRKGIPAHTRVEFATQNMTPSDLIYNSVERGASRKPKYVGLIVWIPREEYEEFERREGTSR